MHHYVHTPISKTSHVQWMEWPPNNFTVWLARFFQIKFCVRYWAFFNKNIATVFRTILLIKIACTIMFIHQLVKHHTYSEWNDLQTISRCDLLGFSRPGSSKKKIMWLTRFFQTKILESCWYFWTVTACKDRAKPSKSKNWSNSILTKMWLTRFFQTRVTVDKLILTVLIFFM